jgi:hypothetical protein
MYTPLVSSARFVRERRIDPRHTAVLLTDIESPHHSRIKYAHLLVVYATGRKDPIAIISAEPRRPLASVMQELGLPSRFDLPDDRGVGSHFLCAFLPDRHVNCGSSDDWADLDKFAKAALDLLPELLALDESDSV